MNPASGSRLPRLRTLVKVLATVGVLGFLGHSCVMMIPACSPPGRLVNRLHQGMTLEEVRARAEDLGFAWQVDERRLESGLPADAAKFPSREPRPGRLICHQRGAKIIGPQPGDAQPADGYLCENASNVTSFGAFWNSYACNVVMKNGHVAEFWFYMD